MKSKYFRIEELVPKELYDVLGEKMCWKLFDDRLIEMLDKIKEKFPDGSMTVNNWVWGGDRNWSGLRLPGKPYYSPTSQHSLGKAIDAVFSAYTAEEVRHGIMANIEEFPYIKGIEDDVSWLHVDVRDRQELLVFKA